MTRLYRRITRDLVDDYLAAGWHVAGATPFALEEVGVLVWRDGEEQDEWTAALGERLGADRLARFHRPSPDPDGHGPRHPRRQAAHDRTRPGAGH